MSDKLPPYAEEAEMATAGCVLLDAPFALKVLAEHRIGPAHFYDKRCAAVIKIAAELHRAGSAVDDILLLPRLDAIGVGVEWDFLESLRSAAPSAFNVEYYVPDLQEKFKRRALIQFAQKALRIGYDETASLESLDEAAEQFTRYIHAAGGHDDLPPITTGTAALAVDLPEPPALIADILHEGTKMVLGGGSKSNKTWVLIDAAVSVAHGEPWLSNKTRKSKVLYVNLELPDWSFQRRLNSVRAAKNIREPNLLEIWHLRGYVAPYDVMLPKVKQRIRESGYSLVILDPIYKITGDLKENSAEDMTRLMNALESLAVECGSAIVFGAHFSKGNQAAKESMDRISGSGVFARDPDTILVMTRHEEENAFTIEATLRNLKPVEPFVVRWDYPLFRRDNSLDPTKLKQAKGRTPEYALADILSVLPDAGLTTAQWQKVAQQERGITRATFYRLHKSATTAGKVMRNGRDKWQVSEVSEVAFDTNDTSSIKNPIGFDTDTLSETEAVHEGVSE